MFDRLVDRRAAYAPDADHLKTCRRMTLSMNAWHFLLIFFALGHVMAFVHMPPPTVLWKGETRASLSRAANEEIGTEGGKEAEQRAPVKDTVSSESSGASPSMELQSKSPSRIQDLVRLLHASEDPLWELVKFEAETSAAQDDKAAGLIQQRVLDRGGIQSAARDFLATKLQGSNLPVCGCRRQRPCRGTYSQRLHRCAVKIYTFLFRH